MEILVTRHGQTDWNVQGKIQGIVDTELNDTGRAQAKEVHEMLKNEPLDLIISSPLKRAYETASIIKGNRDIELITDDAIKERSFGEYEGLIPEQEGFKGTNFWNYKANEQYERAENIRDCFNRVYKFLDELPKKYPNKKILLVSHGGISIPIRCYFEGIPDYETLIGHGLSLKNAEVKKYVYGEK